MTHLLPIHSPRQLKSTLPDKLEIFLFAAASFHTWFSKLDRWLMHSYSFSHFHSLQPISVRVTHTECEAGSWAVGQPALLLVGRGWKQWTGSEAPDPGMRWCPIGSNGWSPAASETNTFARGISSSKPRGAFEEFPPRTIFWGIALYRVARPSLQVLFTNFVKLNKCTIIPNHHYHPVLQ